MSWCCQACACWGAHPPPTPTNAAGTTCHSCWLQNVAQELNRPKRLIPFSAIQATSFGDAAASWLKCCACESVHCNPYEPETSGPGLAENFPQKAVFKEALHSLYNTGSESFLLHISASLPTVQPHSHNPVLVTSQFVTIGIIGMPEPQNNDFIVD